MALIIRGGYSPDHMRRYEAMVRLVSDRAAQGKLAAPICHGPWMHCSAGVLENRRVTSYPSIKDDVTRAGGTWIDEEVVEDGNLVTSRQPADLPAFMRTIVEAVSAAHVTA